MADSAESTAHAGQRRASAGAETPPPDPRHQTGTPAAPLETGTSDASSGPAPGAVPQADPAQLRRSGGAAGSRGTGGDVTASPRGSQESVEPSESHGSRESAGGVPASLQPVEDQAPTDSRSHSAGSLLTEEAGSQASGDATQEEEQSGETALSARDTLSSLRSDDQMHELLQELDSDVADPNEGFSVLDDLFTSGKINEGQYKDLRRKYKYLQSMFWECLQSRAGLKEDIRETYDYLQELKEKTRQEESTKAKTTAANEIPELHTIADLEGKNVDDLKKFLSSFDQQRKTLDNSIYQIKFKTRHMQEEKEQLQEQIDASNVSSSKIYLNSPTMLEKEIRELGVEIRVRKQEIRNLRDDIDTKKRLIPQKEAKIKKLEEKITALQDEKEEILPKMVLVTRDADREEKHRSKLRKQIDALGAEVAEIIGKLKESTDASQKIDNERNELIKAMDKQYKLLDAKSKECAALSRDTDQCRERSTLLMDEKNHAQSRLAMLASEMRHETLALRDLHKAVERVERDVRGAEESLHAQRDQFKATRSEMEKVAKQAQQQTRQAAEVPAQRQALQKEVTAAHEDTAVLASMTTAEEQNLKRLAKERALLLRQQEQLTKALDTLCRQHSNLIRQRDTNARVFRKLSGDVERNEDELRNRITVVAKYRKKCEETEKRTKELADRYELAKKERDEMSAQLNISLTNCDELLKKTDILKSQQDTMLSRKLELERQHAVTRAITMKTILDKTMTQSTMNQEKDAMRALEAQCDQLDMMIGCSQMTLNAIKETIMSDLEEFKRQVVDRNERGLLLVERDEEVCAFQEKINLQQLFIESGYARIDTAEKDIVELNKIVRSEKHHIKCLRAKRGEMDAMDGRLADTRCQLRQLNAHIVRATDEMETPARRQCRLLAGPAGADADVEPHLRHMELQLYEMELRLLERQMVAEQVGRLADRLRGQIDSSRADSQRLAERVNAGQRSALANSRRLMARAAEAAVAKSEARRLCEERRRLGALLDEARRRVAAGLPPPAGPSPRPTQYLPSDEGSLPLPRPYGAFGPFKPQARCARLRQPQRLNGRDQDHR